MAILRIRKKQNEFVILDKTGLNDRRLSWKAKGLLAYLLSLPSNWEVRISDLTKRSKDGKDSSTSALRELKKYHYVCHSRQRNQRGKFVKGEYDVYETPQTPIKTASHPQPDFPVVENPVVEKPHLINNNISKYTNNKRTAANNSDTENQGNKTKNSNKNTAAFPFLNSQKQALQETDILIGEKLTSVQEEITNKTLLPIAQANALNFDQVVSEAKTALLNPNSFTLSGNNFLKKLNTIAKCIREGRWSTPAEIISNKEKESTQKKTAIQQKISELVSKKGAWQRFLEFAEDKNDFSTVKDYQIKINQIDREINNLMLGELKQNEEKEGGNYAYGI